MFDITQRRSQAIEIRRCEGEEALMSRFASALTEPRAAGLNCVVGLVG